MATETLASEPTSWAQVRRLRRPEPQSRSVTRRTTDGTELGEVGLDATLFGIEPNQDVLHQVVTAQLAAARAGTQSTKTRAEVRGGGAKPFRQKGTGRARQGSTRSPQWVGGGVALGPKPRSYAQKTPKKMIQLALRSALSDRAAQERVVLIDRWSFDTPSTKDGLAALEAIGVAGRVLVVLGDEDGYADRSFGNLPEVQTIMAGELNAYDILVNDWIVFTDQTLPGQSQPGPAPVADDPVDSDDAGSGGTAESSVAEDEADEASTDQSDEATPADEADADGSGS
jgi:large subunit ribosomal protein L4